MRLKYFFISFILSLPFWWGVNVFQEKLEGFLFWKGMADNPQLLMAQIIQEENLETLKPIRNWQVEDLEITAKSAISVFVNSQGAEKILFGKNVDEKLPIASLTKLMAANIVLEFQIEPKELLYPLLIISDNNAAITLTEVIGEGAFVDLMNLEAQYLGLENTHFINATGLDGADTFNYSTVQDLAKFAKHLTTERPLIWEISTIQAFENAVNTNELLSEIPGIIGGKTGETPGAGGCLILIVQAPKGKGYIINVILNSENRFEEMKKLLNWLNSAYKW